MGSLFCECVLSLDAELFESSLGYEFLYTGIVHENTVLPVFGNP